MTGRIIYLTILILMLSHKTSAGGCRNAKPCSRRPKPTTPKVVVETVEPKNATTAINNVDPTTPGVVNEGSTEQVSKGNFTTTSTIMESSSSMELLSTTVELSTRMKQSTRMEPLTTTEQSTSMEPSTRTESSITIEPINTIKPSTSMESSTTMVPSMTIVESSETNLKYTGSEASISATSTTEEFSTTEAPSITEIKSTSEPSCQSSAGGPIAKCPDLNGLEVVFIADSKDCSVFYMCDWGKAKKIKCAAGLYFSSKLNVCDWPANVDCNVG